MRSVKNEDRKCARKELDGKECNAEPKPGEKFCSACRSTALRIVRSDTKYMTDPQPRPRHRPADACEDRVETTLGFKASLQAKAYGDDEPQIRELELAMT